jgi:hypothetical protein
MRFSTLCFSKHEIGESILWFSNWWSSIYQLLQSLAYVHHHWRIMLMANQMANQRLIIMHFHFFKEKCFDMAVVHSPSITNNLLLSLLFWFYLFLLLHNFLDPSIEPTQLLNLFESEHWPKREIIIECYLGWTNTCKWILMIFYAFYINLFPYRIQKSFGCR